MAMSAAEKQRRYRERRDRETRVALDLAARLEAAYRGGWAEAAEETRALWAEHVPTLQAPEPGALPVELLEHAAREYGRKDCKSRMMASVWDMMARRVRDRKRIGKRVT